MHALEAVPKAQGKAGAGLAAYAKELGKAKSKISEYRNAAEVYESCSHVGTSELHDKARHLAEIHKAEANKKRSEAAAEGRAMMMGR